MLKEPYQESCERSKHPTERQSRRGQSQSKVSERKRNLFSNDDNPILTG